MAGLRECSGNFAKQAKERKNGEIRSISVSGQTLEGLETQKSIGNLAGVKSNQICTDSLKAKTLNVRFFTKLGLKTRSLALS